LATFFIKINNFSNEFQINFDQRNYKIGPFLVDCPKSHLTETAFAFWPQFKDLAILAKVCPPIQTISHCFNPPFGLFGRYPFLGFFQISWQFLSLKWHQLKLNFK
jgi:hypothetical protein